MPKMNGSKLYQEIRKADTKVKICFITAFDVYHGEMKKELLNDLNMLHQDKEERLDAECFIQKPIDIDELVKRIKVELNS